MFRFIFIKVPFRGLTDKKGKYFYFGIQNDNSMYRSVCFPQKNMHCSMIFPMTITILEWKFNGFKAAKTMKT